MLLYSSFVSFRERVYIFASSATSLYTFIKKADSFQENFSVHFDDLFKKAFEDDNIITDTASQEEITVEQLDGDATNTFTDVEVQEEESVEQIKVDDEKSGKGD